jgi:hypothetical protein
MRFLKKYSSVASRSRDIPVGRVPSITAKGISQSSQDNKLKFLKLRRENE